MSLPPILQEVVEMYPGREFETGEEYDFVWVRFSPAVSTGFAVKLAQSSDGDFLIEFGEDGAHADPYAAESFLDLANAALAKNARLRQIWKGERLFKAYLEHFEAGRWKSQFYYRRVFLPWFRRKRETIQINGETGHKETDPRSPKGGESGLERGPQAGH